MIDASVDFPEPFGPMIAWTSPFGTSRLTPRRIGLPSTDTWRSVTFKIGSLAIVRFLDSNEHIAVLDLDRVGLHVLRRRKRLHLTGADVKDRTV